MDKRTVLGKRFNSMTTEEKTLFLLEGIYNKVDNINQIAFSLKEANKINKFVANRLLNLMDLQNKTKIWTDDYIDQLKKEISYL